ncbi:MAG: TolC family protein [Puniceicoccaceae bacterium]
MAVGMSLVLLWTGCTSKAYRKRADNEVYKIVAQVEEDLFGKTSDFTIETPYTDRDPDDVSVEEIFADRDREAEIVLSIEEAIDTAIRQSRTYQTEKEQLYLTALTLTGEKYAFSPQFFAGASGSRERFRNGERAETLDGEAGVGQLIKTGTNVSASIATDILEYLTGDPRRTASSTLRFSVFQPLLRGADKVAIAESLTQAERNVIYAVRDYSHFQNEFAKDIVIDYFRLLEQKASVINTYNDYKARQVTTNYLRARSVDREKALSVNQSEQAQLSSRNRYINSIVRYKNTLDNFKTTLGLPQTVTLKLEDAAMEELKEAGLILYDLDARNAFRVAVEHRLPLLNAIDRYEDRQRKVRVAADRLRAQLGIAAITSLDSQGIDDYDQFNLDDVRTTLRLSLDLPIDRLNERNSYRSSLIRFESQLRSLSKTLDDLRSLIDRSLRELDRLKENYRIQTNAVFLAETQVNGALLSIEGGKAIFRDLEEAQDDLIQAQNAQTTALVDYLSARLDLLLDLGILETTTDRFWLTEATRFPLNTVNSEDDPEIMSLDEDVITPEELFAN